MYCSQCGKENANQAVACTGCGVALRQVAPQKTTNPDDARSSGFALLGFLFPLIGIILWLIWRNETPLKANSCAKGAIISIILGVVLFVLAIGALFVSVFVFGWPIQDYILGYF